MQQVYHSSYIKENLRAKLEKSNYEFKERLNRVYENKNNKENMKVFLT